MTCIIGIIDKDNQTIYMGGDSAGVNTTTLALTEREDPKVFINKKFIIGYAGSYRMGQLLMFAKIPKCKKKEPFEYMITKFIPFLKDLFKDDQETIIEDEGVFLIGFKGRLFKVYYDYTVEESKEHFNVCGCGAMIAIGALEATYMFMNEKDEEKNSNYLDNDDLIREILDIVIRHSGGVAGYGFFKELKY